MQHVLVSSRVVQKDIQRVSVHNAALGSRLLAYDRWSAMPVIVLMPLTVQGVSYQAIRKLTKGSLQPFKTSGGLTMLSLHVGRMIPVVQDSICCKQDETQTVACNCCVAINHVNISGTILQ